MEKYYEMDFEFEVVLNVLRKHYFQTLYTVMFWITLRQYMQERYTEAHRDIGEGITGQPVTISFGTSQTVVKPGTISLLASICSAFSSLCLSLIHFLFLFL